MTANQRLVLWLAACMAAIAPLVISYSPYQTAWDDLYFLHRAVGVQRAVWTLDARRWAETFSILTKSPLMPLLAAPWGPAARDAQAVAGLSLVSLAVCLWALILACLYVLARMDVSPWFALLAAVAVGGNPLLNRSAGVFLADLVVSWAILLLLLLIPYEAASAEFSARRGLLWGFTASVGLLAKVTFWPMLLLTAPIVAVIRWRRAGGRGFAHAAVLCALAALPALVIVTHYGKQLVDLAISANLGANARFYASPAASYANVLLSYCREMAPASYVVAGLVIAVLWRRPRRGVAVWIALLLLIAYGAYVSGRPVRDPRYMFPVAVGLPFLLAVAASRTRPVRTTAWVWVMALLVGAALAWPMRWRADVRPAQVARELLEECRARRLTKLMLASDSAGWNIETFLMAREMMGGYHSGIEVHTVVYGLVNGSRLEDDLAQLADSDAVLIQAAPAPDAAAITQRVDAYKRYVMAHGERMEWQGGSGGFEVFRMPRQ